MCDTSLKPLSADFEEAGTIAALDRLWHGITEDCDAVPDLPPWVLNPCMVNVVGSEAETGADGPGEMQGEATALVPQLSALEAALLARLDVVLQRIPTPPVRHTVETASAGGPVPVIALARLLLGACCEVYASVRCSLIAPPGEAAEGTCGISLAARLYKDSCLVATWTSAHAAYLNDLLCHKIAICAPSLHSVPNESAELDLSDLYAHRSCRKALKSNSGAHIISLMTRCTNPGARGWDNVVHRSLHKSAGVQRLCGTAIVISLTGMHSCVHPATRMRWQDRLTLGNALLTKLSTQDVSSFASQCIVEFKEAVRRMVCNCTSPALAMIAALRHLEHPVALLRPCSTGLPCAGLEASATAFVQAAKAAAAAHSTLSIANAVRAAFVAQEMPGPENGTAGSSKHLAWTATYLGAHAHAQWHTGLPAPEERSPCRRQGNRLGTARFEQAHPPAAGFAARKRNPHLPLAALLLGSAGGVVDFSAPFACASSPLDIGAPPPLLERRER